MNGEDRLPEEQDPRNAALLETLRRACGRSQNPPLDVVQGQILAQVWAGLQAGSSHQDQQDLPLLVLLPGQEAPVPQNGQHHAGHAPFPRRQGGTHFLSLLAAACLVLVLLGSLLAVLGHLKQAPGPAASGQKGPAALYVLAAGTLAKVDAVSGQHLWSALLSDAPAPTTLIDATTVEPRLVVAAGTVFVASGSSLSAFKASDGSLLWRAHLSGLTGSSTPVVVKNTLYLSLVQEQIEAIDTSNGALRWQRRLPGAMLTNLASSNGSVVGIAVSGVTPRTDQKPSADLFALDAQSGALRWRVPVTSPQHLNWFVGPSRLVLTNEAVYLAVDQESTVDASMVLHPAQTIGAFALDTGAKLWTSPPLGAFPDTLLTRNGVLYAANFMWLGALQTSTGSLLWQQQPSHADPDAFLICPLCIGTSPMILTDHTLQVIEANRTGYYLAKLDAASGTLQARQKIKALPEGLHLSDDGWSVGVHTGAIPFLFMVSPDLTYCVSFNEDQQRDLIEALSNQNGQVRWQATFSVLAHHLREIQVIEG